MTNQNQTDPKNEYKSYLDRIKRILQDNKKLLKEIKVKIIKDREVCKIKAINRLRETNQSFVVIKDGENIEEYTLEQLLKKIEDINNDLEKWL